MGRLLTATKVLELLVQKYKNTDDLRTFEQYELDLAYTSSAAGYVCARARVRVCVCVCVCVDALLEAFLIAPYALETGSFPCVYISFSNYLL